MYSLNALHTPFLAQKRCKITTIFPTTQIFYTLFSKKISLKKKLKKKRTLRSNCGTARNGDRRGAERFLFARVAEFL